MSKSPENFKSVPEEQAKIEKERSLSDANLLKGGAEYKIDEKGEKILIPTDEQIEVMQAEHKKEIEETLIKVYTERTLSDAELIKGGPAFGKMEDSNFEGKINEGARYIVSKISGQVILEVTEQQRLELSGRGEKVKDAVERLINNIKEQELKRGDEIEIYLRDNTTRVGYYDDEASEDPNRAFDWVDDEKKAYFAIGGWKNRGQFSLGIRGHKYIPVQAIERITKTK